MNTTKIEHPFVVSCVEFCAESWNFCVFGSSQKALEMELRGVIYSIFWKGLFLWMVWEANKWIESERGGGEWRC